jgi:hypothetical protein
MLVLFSFLLVLVATVLLVLGLLTENGLAFIYVSIGMSAFAAVVLVIAVRLGKPKEGSAPAAPAPLVEPEPVRTEPPVDEEWKPAVDQPAPRRAVRPLRTPPPVLVEPDLDVDDDGDLWEAPADQPDWDDELFPIEDYDELSAAEIVAVLGELDAEELALVRERELATRNRRTIVANIDRRLAGP